MFMALFLLAKLYIFQETTSMMRHIIVKVLNTGTCKKYQIRIPLFVYSWCLFREREREHNVLLSRDRDRETETDRQRQRETETERERESKT